MFYRIGVNPNYRLTEEDTIYLMDNNINYVKNDTVAYLEFKAEEKYQLERTKAVLRRIPNDEFYNNLVDNFGPAKAKPTVLRRQSKSK
jgi:hypothetical protein